MLVSSLLRKASSNMAENIMLKSVAARGNTCLTLLVNGTALEESPQRSALTEHGVVKLTRHDEEFVQATELSHDLPKPVTTDFANNLR